MNCPQCGHGRYHSNAFLPLTDAHYAQGATAIMAIGRPWLLHWLRVAQAIHRAINAMRHAYMCDHCGHRWSS